MERIKSLLIPCILLACVAPALAVDFYEISGNVTSGSSLAGYNIDPAGSYVPDVGTYAGQTIDSVFWYTNIYQPNYTEFYAAPMYVSQGSSAIDSNANLRNNMNTAYNNIGGITANSLAVADTYWAQNYGYYGTTYSYQNLDQGKAFAGGAVAFNTMYIGHNQSEFATPSLASSGSYNIRTDNGATSLTIGNLRVLNADTTVTTPDNRGVSHYRISTGSNFDNNNVEVNIGDIYLNDQMLFLHVNAGTWNFTGDVMSQDGVGTDNLVLMLVGNTDVYTADPDMSLRCQMTINESVLDQIIADGQFWVKSGQKGTRIDPTGVRTTATQINLLDPADNGTYDITSGGTVTDPMILRRREFFNVTAANKDYWLRVVDIDGEAGDMVRVHVVPEPATLGLLGLGAVLSFRRKR